MNILELDSFNLANAVKFHDRLNPLLWDSREHLHPEIHSQLIKIADDFRDSLGVNNLELRDITISGSNAAYSYTPHSDIDLHLIVDLSGVDHPEIYRELFDAKKAIYNGEHTITIKGIPVELYVQDAAQDHHSQGIYSIINNDWIQIPRRVQADIDDMSVRSKYTDLSNRIDKVVKTEDLTKMNELAAKIKKMRQEGLAEHGEFGPENLVFKMLRNQGHIEQLRTARHEAKSKELSLKERVRKPKTIYGYGRDFVDEVALTPGGVSDNTKMFVEKDEDPQNSQQEIIEDFIDFCSAQLSLAKEINLRIRRDPAWSVRNKTFGRYDQQTNELNVGVSGRHIMDILRTVAHELVHQRQNETQEMPPDAGADGSEYENEANAQAAVLMRRYGKLHPELFVPSELNEEFIHEIDYSSQLDDSNFSHQEIINKSTVDGQIEGQDVMTISHGKERAYFLVDKDKITAFIGFYNNNLKNIKNFTKSPGVIRAILGYLVHIKKLTITISPDDPLTFDGIKWISHLITSPRGLTIKDQDGNAIDVEALNQEWEYAKKTGESGTTGIIISEHVNFGNKIRINQAKRQSDSILMPVNFYESSGYIPTAAEADDPRFEMALTADVRPGALGKAANSFLLNTDSQGHPQELRPDGLVKRMTEELALFKKKYIKKDIVETIDVDYIHTNALREHLLSNPSLYEDRDDFQKMRDFLDVHKTPDPKIEKSYIYASIQSTPISKYVNTAYFNNQHKLVKIDRQYAYFNIDGFIKRFPESGTLSGDSMSQIYFFNSTSDLAHFNTLMQLKFSDYKFTSKILDQQELAESSSQILTAKKSDNKLKFSRDKLDDLLNDLCEIVIKGQEEAPDFYGMVAAAVIDPTGRLATGVNYLYGNERIHAERAAIDNYEKKYGELPPDCVVVTTLSPCSQDTGDVKEVTCTEVLNKKHVKLAYCGYRDPTQHRHNNNFTVIITENSKLERLCKQLADTFLDKSVSEEVIWEDEHDPEVDEWLNEDVRQHLLTMPHLFENDDRYTDLKDFLSSHDNIKPYVGNSYAIVTIRSIPVGHTISIAKTTNTKELLDIFSSKYIFNFGNRTRSIPKSKFNEGDLLSYTLLFNNTNQLEHFIVLLKLKYSDWQTPVKDLQENFADGKGPGRPGDSVRHGIPKHATMAELEKASHAKGRKGQLARWQLNMRNGHKK